MIENKFDTIEDAITALKKGEMVIIHDDENREDEGDFVILGEYATPEAINFMITHGKGLVCMPISIEIAKRLDLNPMVMSNTDRYKTAFTVSIDHISTNTGISAFERSQTIKQVTNENSTQSDFRRPGHIFPITAKPNGVLERKGHTEASIDLAKICGAKEVAVICEILDVDGKTAKLPNLFALARKHNLKIIKIEDLVKYRKQHDKLVIREIEVSLPTDFGDFNIVGYSNFLDYKEHIALTKNIANSDKTPLVRVHSSCLTGDVFHSKRCDCGEQLEKALHKIEEYGCGVLIYLSQEGRDIGLINKLRAYKLQQENIDTVEANHMLGFATDLREYTLAAHILRDLGIKEINLITNNPDKINALESYGIKVTQRISISTTPNTDNKGYLETKKNKLGHLL